MHNLSLFIKIIEHTNQFILTKVKRVLSYYYYFSFFNSSPSGFGINWEFESYQDFVYV